MPRRQSTRGDLTPGVEVIVCHEPDLQRMAQALLIVLERRRKPWRTKRPGEMKDDQKRIQTTRGPGGH